MTAIPVAVQPPTIDLWATTGRISTPDGHSVLIWGFAGAPGRPAQLPGPTIVVRQGDTVTVNLENTLGEAVSLFFPGQEGVRVVGEEGSRPVRPEYDGARRLLSLVDSAAPPGDPEGRPARITYRFIARNPGTYLYESGTNPHKQVQMGLYGALVVLPRDYQPDRPGGKTAYGRGTDTEYDREYLLVVAEIDPVLHDAVERGEPYDLRSFKPRYWTINGRMAPDTMDGNGVPWLPSQPYSALIKLEPGEKALLRYACAGIECHPLHPHGNHTRVVAFDGRLLRNWGMDLSHKRFTVLMGPGQTCDQIYEWTGLGYSPDNPIPTVVPNIQNMDVGDAGWTMFSGSPYLGVKGDVPVGVVSYNEVGEYHFMLHSHEEMQITNWGEFPGGMMTMIAVYPPGTLGPDVGQLV